MLAEGSLDEAEDSLLPGGGVAGGAAGSAAGGRGASAGSGASGLSAAAPGVAAAAGLAPKGSGGRFSRDSVVDTVANSA